MSAADTLGTPPATGWRGWLARANYRDGIIDDVIGVLSAAGAIKLSGMHGRDQLVDLASQFGEVFLPELSATHHASPELDDLRLYEVRVKNEGRGELDKYGEPILSTVSADFDLHTDGYSQAAPPKYILLLRTDNSVELPATYLVDGFLLFDQLNEAEKELLQRPIFPSAQGLLPALRIDKGMPRFRWNSELMQRWARREEKSQSKSLAEAAEMLYSHLAKVIMCDELRRGDCLILDNERWLHGRSALQSDSTRVLQRAWVGGDRG